MALSTADRRRFPPSKLWGPLFDLNQAHLQHVIDTEQVSAWSRKQDIWILIFSNLRQQEEGLILETERIFSHIRLCDWLAQNDDKYFRLAVSLLSRPIYEDLLERDGLYGAIEDIFLKKYGFAPRMSGYRDGVVGVTFPPFWSRVVLRHPSPRRVQRDFEELTNGILGMEFGTHLIGRVLFFGVGLPLCDDEPSNSEFVREALAMIKRIESGV